MFFSFHSKGNLCPPLSCWGRKLHKNVICRKKHLLMSRKIKRKREIWITGVHFSVQNLFVNTFSQSLRLNDFPTILGKQDLQVSNASAYFCHIFAWYGDTRKGFWQFVLWLKNAKPVLESEVFRQCHVPLYEDDIHYSVAQKEEKSRSVQQRFGLTLKMFLARIRLTFESKRGVFFPWIDSKPFLQYLCFLFFDFRRQKSKHFKKVFHQFCVGKNREYANGSTLVDPDFSSWGPHANNSRQTWQSRRASRVFV